MINCPPGFRVECAFPVATAHQKFNDAVVVYEVNQFREASYGHWVLSVVVVLLHQQLEARFQIPAPNAQLVLHQVSRERERTAVSFVQIEQSGLQLQEQLPGLGRSKLLCQCSQLIEYATLRWISGVPSPPTLPACLSLPRLSKDLSRQRQVRTV